jgi:PcfJ-like protein
VQLTSLRELVDEGVAQRHCVSTYERGCREGRCSIWSLRRRVDGRVERVLTLELTARREVAQVRGRANRLATRAERDVLSVWAAERGVTLDR